MQLLKIEAAMNGGDSMSTSVRKASRDRDEKHEAQVKTVLKALEGFSLSSIKDKPNGFDTTTNSKRKLNSHFKDALLKVLASREQKTA
jgi:hypothetical protein